MNDNKNEEKSNITSEYVAQYAIKGGIVFKNGSASICPFRPVTYEAPKLAGGAPKVINFPCNVGCPKCNLIRETNSEKKTEVYYVEISCGGAVQCPPVTIEDELETKNKSLFKAD